MQGIDKDGNQTEIPDPWLTGSNPWEVGESLPSFLADCQRLQMKKSNS